MNTSLTDADLEKKAGALIKTTLVDYPAHVACTFFLKGCNLRCPYCYNFALLDGTEDETFVSANEVISHLQKRQKVITGFVLSGGEPLLNPLTPYLIKQAKNLGYKIKIDTNGTLPALLENLVNNPELKPDFIAMDLKTSPEKYQSFLSPCKSLQNANFTETLQRTIKIISSYNSNQREFRTVLVPTLVTKTDIEKMSDLLPSDASWQFAQFRNENCLDSKYNSITPYTYKQLNELVEIAKQRIPGANLR